MPCKTNDNLLLDDVSQRKMMALHLDEIHVQSTNTFSDKVNFFGPSHNDPKELASSIQAFLLSTLTGKKTCVNLCSMPVHNMGSECLQAKLIECLDKAKNCDFTVLPIAIDGASINCNDQ